MFDALRLWWLRSKLKRGGVPTRLAAATALGSRCSSGETRAVEPLAAAALTDADAEVRRHAVAALARLGDGLEAAVAAVVIEPLAAVLKDPDARVRNSAAWALSRVADWRPRTPSVRASAANALAVAARDADSGVRRTAGRGLKDLGWAPANAEQRVALAIATCDFQHAVAEGPGVTLRPLLEVLQGTDRMQRATAAKALGDLGDRHAVGPLIAALKDTDGDVRASAASALGRLGDAAALGALALSLRWWGADSDAIRGRAHRDIRAQAAAAAALGKLRDGRAVEALLLARRDNIEEVRGAAMGALAELGDTAFEPLLAALDHENTCIREEAVATLGER